MFTNTQQENSAQWAAYFKQNALTAHPSQWQSRPQWSRPERDDLLSSIQKFQLGENSEGRNLYRAAQEYAKQSNDPLYVEAITSFIREEQRHAQYLRQFLLNENAPLLKKEWTDTIFRSLRRKANLETSITVLVTAEIIAKLYYAALKEATSSPILQTLCDQMLADEEMHIRFHAERLAIIHQSQSLPQNGLRHLAHWVLLSGTILVVWGQHRPVFRRAHYSFAHYWRSCWQEFQAITQLEPGLVIRPAA